MPQGIERTIRYFSLGKRVSRSPELTSGNYIDALIAQEEQEQVETQRAELEIETDKKISQMAVLIPTLTKSNHRAWSFALTNYATRHKFVRYLREGVPTPQAQAAQEKHTELTCHAAQTIVSSIDSLLLESFGDQFFDLTPSQMMKKVEERLKPDVSPEKHDLLNEEALAICLRGHEIHHQGSA